MSDLRMEGNTGDITANSAVMEMARLSRQLDVAGEELKRAEREYVEAEHRYRIEKAKALLRHQDGTVPEREARALLEVDDVRLKAKLAEANLRIRRSDVRILESRIDVGRSVVGVLRVEASITR